MLLPINFYMKVIRYREGKGVKGAFTLEAPVGSFEWLPEKYRR